MHARSYKILTNSIQAFTILEMIIAIFIISTGIFTIVSLLLNNISRTNDIHRQNIAVILAREGIELTYNYRDTNELLGYQWNCAIREGECAHFFVNNNEDVQRFRIEWLTNTTSQTRLELITSESSLQEQAQLYLTTETIWEHTFTWYTHQVNGQKSVFWRYIEFRPLKNLPSNTAISSGDIYHINSIVTYTTSTRTWQIHLESFIGKRF